MCMYVCMYAHTHMYVCIYIYIYIYICVCGYYSPCMNISIAYLFQATLIQ